MTDDLMSQVIGQLQAARLNDFPIHFSSPPHVNLRLVRTPYRVFTKTPIAAGTFLGYVIGRYLYSWEVPDPMGNPYLFVVDDDYVIDASVSEVPTILTFVREGFFVGLSANVGIVPEPTIVSGAGGASTSAATEGLPRIGLRTLVPIAAGEELVYTAGKYYEI
jgi:hypothetical protein